MPVPVMYIFINKGLGMSSGKMAAQAAHAAVEGYRLSSEGYIEDWYMGKHYTKIVMQARNANHLVTIQKYLKDRGIKSSLIIDEGMTEIDPHTPTALGVQIVYKGDPGIDATFSTFELYRDTIKVTLEIPR